MIVPREAPSSLVSVANYLLEGDANQGEISIQCECGGEMKGSYTYHPGEPGGFISPALRPFYSIDLETVKSCPHQRFLDVRAWDIVNERFLY